MKKMIAVFLVNAITMVIHAKPIQTDSAVITAQRHYVKWAPLHLFNFYPTVQIAYEYQWKNKFGFQVEGGYVVHVDDSVTGLGYFNKRGFKLQTEFRRYFGKSERRSHYVAGEIHVFRIHFDRQTVPTDPGTTQRDWYEVTYREQGITAKYGWIWRMGNFLLDVNLGWRVGLANYKKPSGMVEPSTIGIFFVDGPNEHISVRRLPVLGFRAGWLFAQRRK